MAHFLHDRPRHGYCLLDFIDRWLWDAIYAYQNPDEAYKHARELGHWAMLMHPELAPMPHNIVLGQE